MVDAVARAQPVGPVDEQRRPSRRSARRTGSTSYAETQVTSSWTGSGASSTGGVVISAATRATATAVSATRTASSAVSTTPEAKPHAPPWIDADREAEVLGVAGALEHAVAHAERAGSGPARSGSRRG